VHISLVASRHPLPDRHRVRLLGLHVHLHDEVRQSGDVRIGRGGEGEGDISYGWCGAGSGDPP
jgi:hypothetical protein